MHTFVHLSCFPMSQLICSYIVGDDAVAWRDLLPMLVCSHLFASMCVSATILARAFIQDMLRLPNILHVLFLNLFLLRLPGKVLWPSCCICSYQCDNWHPRTAMKMKKEQKKQMVEQMSSTHELRITYYNKRGHNCMKGLGQPSLPANSRWISALSRSPCSKDMNRFCFLVADGLDRTEPPFAYKGLFTPVWWYKPIGAEGCKPEWQKRLGTSHPAGAGCWVCMSADCLL